MAHNEPDRSAGAAITILSARSRDWVRVDMALGAAVRLPAGHHPAQRSMEAVSANE